jgi:hypothetical protein
VNATIRRTAATLTRTFTRGLAGEVTVWTAGTTLTGHTVKDVKTTTTWNQEPEAALLVNAILLVSMVVKMKLGLT